MDMIDIARAQGDSRLAGDGNAHWCRVLAQVGGEAAGPLTQALERADALLATGRIERHELLALRQEMADARRTAMAAQQLARYAAGRLHQAHERLNLTQLLREASMQRATALRAGGIELRQALKPAEVIADASLLFELVNALFDWAQQHATALIELRLQHTAWPAHAVLACHFEHGPTAIDSVRWWLLHQMAHSMGLGVERLDDGARCTLTLEFARTVHADMPDSAESDLEHEHEHESLAGGPHSRPLAGSHVLVLAPRRELRLAVREALHPLGLLVDFVASIDEARAFCEGALPHALVFASSVSGERLDALRAEIDARVRDFVFIQIDEEGDSFEVSGFAGLSIARVGRDVVATGLPSALVFELSKNP